MFIVVHILRDKRKCVAHNLTRYASYVSGVDMDWGYGIFHHLNS